MQLAGLRSCFGTSRIYHSHSLLGRLSLDVDGVVLFRSLRERWLQRGALQRISRALATVEQVSPVSEEVDQQSRPPSLRGVQLKVENGRYVEAQAGATGSRQ